MNIRIKKMETDDEISGKAYVHWKAWQEAYEGLVDQNYLDRLTLEKCEEMAHSYHPEDTLIALDDDKVIGFLIPGECRNEDLKDAGEIIAVYVLKEYYGSGAGMALMAKGLEMLKQSRIAVWVLKDNKRAVRFYEKWGFIPDGQEKELKLVTPVVEMRMILDRNKNQKGV